MDSGSRWMAFWAGVTVFSGASMFRQDLLGLDRYIESVRAGWIETSPGWGFAAMVLGCVMFALSKNKD